MSVIQNVGVMGVYCSDLLSYRGLAYCTLERDYELSQRMSLPIATDIGGPIAR